MPNNRGEASPGMRATPYWKVLMENPSPALGDFTKLCRAGSQGFLQPSVYSHPSSSSPQGLVIKHDPDADAEPLARSRICLQSALTPLLARSSLRPS